MRPFIAIILVGSILGSVAAYGWFVRSLPKTEVVDLELDRATGEFTVDLTLTFDAVNNAFTLEPTSILVKFEGQSVYHSAETVYAGTPLEIPVSGVKVGMNEFYIEINTPDVEVGRPRNDDGFSLNLDSNEASEPVRILSHAARIRVLRDGETIADETRWSQPGQPIRDTVIVEVPDSTHTGRDHNHPH